MNLTDGRVIHYSGGESGRQNRGVSFPHLNGVDVLVRPTTGSQEDADELARKIRDLLPEIARLRETLRRVKVERDSARDRLAIVLGTKRRMSGPAVIRPADRTSWTGPVWLLDPEKGWGGFGFRFETLSEIWGEMPDLRPTDSGQDEDGPWIRVESHTLRAKD